MITLAVLGGGPSSEHEISLKSAANVCGALDTNKYDVLPVTIDKAGKWHLNDAIYTPEEAFEAFRTHKVGIVFIALHGEFGEDGQVQKLLEIAKIPYTGSNSAASNLAMDKVRSRAEFISHGIPVAKGTVITRDQWHQHHSIASLPDYPVVVKPSNGGSSFGVSMVKDESELDPAVEKAFGEYGQALIEEYIKGREITCGVLDDGQPQVLPPTEIRPKTSGWFDFEAKYQPGASEEITPAPFPEEITKQIQDYALTAHKALGCYGMSRTDMIVRGTDVIVLETNTIPGLTETSLLPQEAAAIGMSFSQLLDRIIESGLKRKVQA
jgi:D-alanine-D-alanine ligase